MLAALPGPGHEVVVFNTSQDIVEMLRLAIGEEGYRVGVYHIYYRPLRRGLNNGT